MIQVWHWFAIGNILASSVSSLYIRKVMKDEDNDPILFAIAFQFMLTLIVLIFSLYKGFAFPPPSSVWLRFVIGATLYAIGTICSFYASKHIGAGEMTILTSSGSLITIIIGVLFLGNPFGWGKGIGTALILSSIFILYGNEKMKMNKGFWCALGVSFFYGIAVINDVIILQSYDAMSFLPIMCFLPGFIIFLMFPKRILKIQKLLKPLAFQHIVLYSFFYGIASIFFYLTLSNGATISQLSPIGRASIITTVILSAIFLGERNNIRRKIISAITVTIGVILLA